MKLLLICAALITSSFSSLHNATHEEANGLADIKIASLYNSTKLICRNPSDEKLREALAKLYGEVVYSMYEEVPPTGFPILFNRSQAYKERECSNTLRPNARLQEKSICPWTKATYQRKAIFPFNVSHAVCQCKDCIGFHRPRKEGNISYDREIIPHACFPVQVLMPALRMTKNCIAGFFVWEPIMEYVSIGCTCGRNFTFSIANDQNGPRYPANKPFY
jgi:hypothetical protein